MRPRSISDSLTQECSAGFQVISGVMGEGRPSWVGADSFPLPHCRSKKGNMSAQGGYPACSLRPLCEQLCPPRSCWPPEGCSHSEWASRLPCVSHNKDHSLGRARLKRFTGWCLSPDCPLQCQKLCSHARDMGVQRLCYRWLSWTRVHSRSI